MLNFKEYVGFFFFLVRFRDHVQVIIIMLFEDSEIVLTYWNKKLELKDKYT